MPSYRCKNPVCLNYLAARAYCPNCSALGEREKAARNSYYDRHQRDPEARKFYNSSAWNHPDYGARAIKVRISPICERCRDRVVEHVHHTTPLLELTPAQRIDQAFLMSVCQSCHNALTAEERRRAAGA